MANVGRMVKESIAEQLATQLGECSNVFVTRVNRLSAPAADHLRQKLFASKARLLVVKRRIGQRTIEQLKIAGLGELLEGSVGLILSAGDVLPTAKLLVEFIKTHEEQLTVCGALIDGQLLDKRRVEQLASLPPRPILLAHVVATIESPIADVIFTIERLIGDLAWLAEQAATKKLLPAAHGERQAGAEVAPSIPAAPTPTPTQDAPSSTPSAQTPPTTQEGT